MAADASFLSDVGIVLGVAAGTAVVARAVRLPTVLGYLVAGLIVGPYLPVPLFADPHRIHALSEFGVVLVMFAIGLEFRLGRFIRSLPIVGLTGLVEVGAMLWAGFTLGQAFGWNTLTSLFLGSALAISSTMTVSKIFEQRPVAPDVREHVLSVLVFQDVMAIVLIAAMTAVAKGGGLAPDELAVTLLRLAAVLVAMIAVGLWVLPRLLRVVLKLETPEITTVFSVGVCFALALVAGAAGFSVALGAFIGGIVVAESGRAAEVEHMIAPVKDVFVAIFFVSIGMTVDPVSAWEYMPEALAVSGAVIAMQLAAVGTAGVFTGLGLRRSVHAGLSLGQIGEFGFILIGIGIAAGVADPVLQPVVVTVAVVTTFTTPLMMRAADRVIGWLDHVIPARLQHFLSLYEAWLERLRATPAEGPSPIRRTVRALALDAVGVLLVMASAIAWLPELSGFVQGTFDVAPGPSKILVGVAALSLAAPLLYHLIVNALGLARLVSDAVLAADEGAARPGQKLAVHTLRAMVTIAVVLGIGFPAVAVLRPLLPGAYAIPLLLALLVILVVFLWRRAGALDQAYLSGAATIARRLAERAHLPPAPDEEDDPALPHEDKVMLLPGLDTAVGVTLPPTSAAVGKSLRELNIRTLTGAHVVALDRGPERHVLPTGSERLAAGDVVGLVGTTAAVDKARELLVDAAPAEGGDHG